MSYLLVIPEIKIRLEAVSGMALVEAGEPKQIAQTPYAYFMFARGLPIGQTDGMTYIVMIRVMVPWLDNDSAEEDIAPFVHSIPDTFSPRTIDGNGHAYAKLGGTVDSAIIKTLDSGEQGGFHTVKDTPYRSITYELEIKENNP